MGISLDLSLGLNREGVKFAVKNVDINGFVIDKVFKKLNKKAKKKELENKQYKIVEESKPVDDGLYTIEIT